MSHVTLLAPMSGWLLPLAQVPDAVFAQGLAGEGAAIDPIEGEVRAPCDGVVVLPGAAMHAVSVRHATGVEVLVHVGIDTVALRGEGFALQVTDGERVAAGEVLLRFDLDRVARSAKSAVTPVLVVAGGSISKAVSAGRPVQAGDVLCEVEASAAGMTAAAPADAAAPLRRAYRIPFDHGLHARPAAQIVAALGDTRCAVTLHAGPRQANARSAVSMMSLGAQAGDVIDAVAIGADAEAAHRALGALLVAVEPPHARSGPVGASGGGLPAPRPLPSSLEGTTAAPGIAIGVSVALRPIELTVPERGHGEASERAALDAARARVASHLRSRAEGSDVFAAHLALLADPELDALAAQALRDDKSAAWAWREATRRVAVQLGALGDERMRERAADLRDLESQVLQVLAGDEPCAARALPEHAVLFADEVLPSQLAALDASRIVGIVMARGGPTSHVALLAAARGIPTLVGAGDGVLAVGDGHAVLIDTAARRVAIDPPEAELAALRERIAQRQARAAADLATCGQPAVTRDGVAVAVHANIGAVDEIASSLRHGAEGCGLLRTEFMFLHRRDAPGEDEQYECYAAAARAFDGRPLTLRTLDVGGDKPLAYLPMPREDNPALGVRGVRVGLRAAPLLRTQLRAMLRAAAHGPVRAMLPMVNDLAELRTVRQWLREAARELGIHTLPRLGVMIETPAAALLADQLAREADFLSIGSNDLSQYVLAMDRGNDRLASELDALHPAVLRAIAQVVQSGRAAGRSVSLCGGLASDLDALPLLAGLGLREISCVPSAVPAVKRVLRALRIDECEALAAQALQSESAAQVRALLRTHVAANEGAAEATAALSTGAVR